MPKMSDKLTSEETQSNLPADAVEQIDWSKFSYEEALGVAKETMLTANADTMGDGFHQLRSDEKAQLVKKPFFIVSGRFSAGVGKYGEKVTVRLITADNKRYWFNDGSEGIYKQLRDLVPDHLSTFGEIHCPKGLRASHFHWDAEKQRVTKDGEPNACTYYIDFS